MSLHRGCVLVYYYTMNFLSPLSKFLLLLQLPLELEDHADLLLVDSLSCGVVGRWGEGGGGEGGLDGLHPRLHPVQLGGLVVQQGRPLGAVAQGVL